MAEEKNGKWVTLENGTHLFIKNGQTLDDAIATLGKGKEKQPTHSGSGGKDFEHKKELTITVNTLLKEGKNKDQIKNYLKGFNTVDYTEEMDKYVDSLIDFGNDTLEDYEAFDEDYDFENWEDENNSNSEHEDLDSKKINDLLDKYNNDTDRVLDELRKTDWGLSNGDLQGVVEAQALKRGNFLTFPRSKKY